MTDNDEPRVAVPPIHPLGTRLTARTDSGPRAPKWRVEIVEDDYGRVKHEEIVDNWWAARVRLARLIDEEGFLTGDCMDCRLNATDAFNRLAAMGEVPGPRMIPAAFEAYIEGDLYRITLVDPED